MSQHNFSNFLLQLFYNSLLPVYIFCLSHIVYHLLSDLCLMRPSYLITCHNPGRVLVRAKDIRHEALCSRRVLHPESWCRTTTRSAELNLSWASLSSDGRNYLRVWSPEKWDFQCQNQAAMVTLALAADIRRSSSSFLNCDSELVQWISHFTLCIIVFICKHLIMFKSNSTDEML